MPVYIIKEIPLNSKIQHNYFFKLKNNCYVVNKEYKTFIKPKYKGLLNKPLILLKLVVESLIKSFFYHVIALTKRLYCRPKFGTYKKQQVKKIPFNAKNARYLSKAAAIISLVNKISFVGGVEKY
jgi:hypothetical protein